MHAVLISEALTIEEGSVLFKNLFEGKVYTPSIKPLSLSHFVNGALVTNANGIFHSLFSGL